MFDSLANSLVKSTDRSSFWPKDKIFLFRELSYLVEWWLSLPVAVDTIKQNSHNMAVVNICNQIYSWLKKWEPLYRSMTKLNKYFNDWDINIIKSWESSWELQNVLQYLASEYEFIFDIRNKYIGAMVYPILVFMLSIWAVVIILKYVLPWIITMVDQFQWATIPTTTKIIIWLSEFFTNYSMEGAVFIWLFILFVSIVYSVDEWKYMLDRWILKLPILWRITMLYNLLRYLRYMRLLIRAWLSYLDVFQLLKQISANSIYQQMTDDIITYIRKWESIITVMKMYPEIIPANIIALLKAWEETASITKSIENWIWFYEQEFNKILNNLSKIIEPILIIFVGWVIWFIAISVFGIIWSVLDAMQT